MGIIEFRLEEALEVKQMWIDAANLLTTKQTISALLCRRLLPQYP